MRERERERERERDPSNKISVLFFGQFETLSKLVMTVIFNNRVAMHGNAGMGEQTEMMLTVYN